ncbi:MAG: 30S ribosomal protein S27ae [Nanoarchaeota archaeon]
MAIKAKIKGKKKHKNNPTSKKYTKYKVDGNKIVREKYCPRCGPGIFLLQGQNRLYCGKCHLTEFVKEK